MLDEQLEKINAHVSHLIYSRSYEWRKSIKVCLKNQFNFLYLHFWILKPIIIHANWFCLVLVNMFLLNHCSMRIVRRGTSWWLTYTRRTRIWWRHCTWWRRGRRTRSPAATSWRTSVRCSGSCSRRSAMWPSHDLVTWPIKQRSHDPLNWWQCNLCVICKRDEQRWC